jgi:ferritin heavy chain
MARKSPVKKPKKKRARTERIAETSGNVADVSASNSSSNWRNFFSEITLSPPRTSFVQQNLSSRVVAYLNESVNRELHASYVYLCMAAYFSGCEVALHGFAAHFRAQADEEAGHAKKMINYVVSRGAVVEFTEILPPSKQIWSSPKDAFEDALELERFVNQCLLDVHSIATELNDVSCTDFLEAEYLQNQVKEIKEVGDMITRLKNAGSGIGVVVIDQELKTKFGV